MSLLWVASIKEPIDEADIDKDRHHHLRLPIEHIEGGDLVRPLYSKKAAEGPFERTDGVVHDKTHMQDSCFEDPWWEPDETDERHMYLVKYPRYFGPHAPDGTKYEVYRPKGQ